MKLRAITADTVKLLARKCGFELAGVAPVEPPAGDFARFEYWMGEGMAGKMSYLTDRRSAMRSDARNLLPSARSVICVGKLYNQQTPPFTEGHAVISRYALGRDYHEVLADALKRLAEKLLELAPFEYKICVDTAPLLERSYARQAGLGWIGRNTCLINEPHGSWFFLGELITSMELAPDSPPPDRCGTCTRCIDACPTQAIVPVVSTGGSSGQAIPEHTVDARRCISYLNIELKGGIPEEHRAAIGPYVFGCDICQEVCPWNARAPETDDPAFAPRIDAAPPLKELARLSESDFRERYRNTPVTRPKYDGFMRNVAVAMGASGAGVSGSDGFREPLEQLAGHPSALVAEHAKWAMDLLTSQHGKFEAPETPLVAETPVKDTAECVES